MIDRYDINSLRTMTEMTGQLIQPQIQTIQAWPKIAFKEVKSYETKIDLDNRRIEYVLKLKPKKTITDFKALKIIEESNWALCGDTWQTSFMVGGRILYAGNRRQEIRDVNGISLGKGRAGFDPSRA